MSSPSFYLLRVSYVGTSYSGWQIQNNQKTVQGELDRTLRVLAKGGDIKSLASGRTDAGVHAWGQLDIRVLEVRESNQDFHPIRDNFGKEYRYYFSLNGISTPFASPYFSQVNTKEGSFLDSIEKGCALFEGTRQFQDFYCEGSEFKTWEKTIYSCRLFKHSELFGLGPQLGDVYEIRVSGNGFLKQMVRLIVGTLWELGKGNVDPLTLEDSLSGNPKGKLGPVAPAKGLHLAKVFESPIK
jgi:tRNA pseudouridine38-40 synthase